MFLQSDTLMFITNNMSYKQIILTKGKPVETALVAQQSSEAGRRKQELWN